MCGIAGILSWDGQPADPRVLRRMARTMEHRGPDGEGVWSDGPVGFGHRRLAIIDLTEAASQPMQSNEGSAVITYNGEVYNFQELKAELRLAGCSFRSTSDTEVVLKAYEAWGPACVSRFNGHFAFAIWDGERRQLFLARDRFGVKPLYYHCSGNRFLFGSEIKAILAHPGVERRVNGPALNEYFTFQNILSDRTLFDGVHLLPPGCTLTVTPDRRGAALQERYWECRPGSIAEGIDFEEAAEELRSRFETAVERQLVSDVPIACYLSGGMDSGSITAIARRNLGRLMTFTMGFDLSSASGLELGFDERAGSEALSNLLKTEHYEMVLHAGDMEHAMPGLIWHLEDLRVGQSYPNYYVARLAGKFVKVVLAGTGGDELFGGYPWRYYRGLNSACPETFYRNHYAFWQRLVPDEEKSRLFTLDAARRIGDLGTYDVFKSVLEPLDLPLATNHDFVNASLCFEFKTFLHGLLVMEDRLSMAHSLETRAPFLDNDVMDFALSLPAHFKIRNLDRVERGVDEDDVGRRKRYELQNGDGKRILRKAMSSIIPPEITQRTKQGFSAPDASWFRGESIDYVNKLLRNPNARICEFFQPDYVGRKLDEHTSGRRNHRLLIWSWLSFEWWLRKFM